MGADFKPLLRASSAFYFLFSVRESRGLITGVVYPSADSQGRFSFLIIALSSPLEEGSAHVIRAVKSARAFYRAASNLASTAVHERLSREEFIDLALELPGMIDHVSDDEARTFHDPGIMHELRNVLGELRTEQIARIKLAFRLPIDHGNPDRSVVDWIGTCLSMIEAGESSPCAFWKEDSQATSGPSVVLSVSEPPPSVLLSVMDYTYDLDEVMNLADYMS